MFPTSNSNLLLHMLIHRYVRRSCRLRSPVYGCTACSRSPMVMAVDCRGGGWTSIGEAGWVGEGAWERRWWTRRTTSACGSLQPSGTPPHRIRRRPRPPPDPRGDGVAVGLPAASEAEDTLLAAREVPLGNQPEAAAATARHHRRR